MTKTVWVGKNKNQVPIVKPSIPVSENGNYVDDAYEFDFRGGMSVANAGFGRMQVTASGSSGELGSSVSAGATSIDTNGAPSWFGVGSYLVIDPFTIECEVRKVTAWASGTATVAALTYAHSQGDALLFEDTDVINARWFGAKGDFVDSDNLPLQRAMRASDNTDSHEVFIPAGIYKITYEASGWYFYLHVADQVLRGAGMGQTILKMEDNFSWTGDINLIRAWNTRQKILDLTITAGSNMNAGSTTGAFGVITLTEWGTPTTYCKYSEIRRVEIRDLVGGTIGAGGHGFGTYCSWWTHDVDTTFAEAITVPGSQAVTPASMDGMWVGKRLFVDWTNATTIGEEIVITSISKTQITATFAGTHLAGVRIVGYCHSETYCLIEDCYIHDCHQIVAFGTGSNANRYVRCKAVRGTGTAQCHGFYNQGGDNVYDSCWVEGWCGYSYHNYKNAARRSTTGDIFVNCVSINPDFKHFHCASLDNGTPNPYNADYPVGAELDRYIRVIGCTFKNTNGLSSEGISSNHPIIVQGCAFDDVYGTGGGGIVHLYNGYGVVNGNIFRFVNEPIDSPSFSCISAPNSVIEGNVIDNKDRTSGVTGIVASGNAIVKGNVLYNASLSLSGEVVCEGNQVINSINFNPLTLSTATNLVIRNNRFETTLGYMCNNNLTNVVAIFEGNDLGANKLAWQTGVNAGFIWRNNIGIFGNAYNASNLNYNSGGLKMYLGAGPGNIEYRRLVKLVSNALEQILVTDATFVGVTSGYVSGTGEGFIVCDSGSECEIDCDDTWVAGNYAVISTSAAGKVHDSGGITTDIRRTVGVFLDSGTGAGVAMVKLI